MSRLLIIGTGPLPADGERYLDARGLRTAQILRPLVDEEHDVHLVTIPPFPPDDSKNSIEERKHEGLRYEALLTTNDAFIQEELARLARDVDADAIVAVGYDAAWHAARLPLRRPLWADLHRYAMSTHQGQSARRGDDGVLREAWRREAAVLRRADKCSAVSRPHLYAMLGEMGRLGRFNNQTHDYQFIHLLPDALHPAFASPIAPDTPAVVRGSDVPADAFIVLWSGGYNYWTDPDFLFDCVERMMESAPEIHYVSTGGAIPEFNDQTYRRFEDLVETSPHRERYHLLGWLPFERVRALHAEADLGLCIDTPNYETFFGARNRLNNMLAAGLPILATWGTEIAALIDETNCGIITPPADKTAIVRGVLDMVRAPEQCRKLSQYARQVGLDEFDAFRLASPLLQWAKAPALAPDNAAKVRLDPDTRVIGDIVLNHLDHLGQVGETRDLAEIEADFHDLEALESKAWFKILVAIKQAFVRGGQLIRKTKR